MALTDLDPTGTSEGAAATFNASSANPLNMVVSGRGYLDTLANKFILKPASAKGLCGFVFDYEGETQINVQSDITDHYSEQNTFINDHAARRPQKITLHGYVGEIVYNPRVGVLGVISTLQSKLTTLPAFLGKYTPGAVKNIQKAATKATLVVNKIDRLINSAQNVVGLFVGSSVTATKKQKAYQNLTALWLNNTVFTLDTPFNYFQSVMIESMTIIEDENTREWAEISVTLKEMRFTGVTTDTKFLSPKLAAQTQLGRSAQQSQAQTNKGKTQGIFALFSNLTNFFNKQNAAA